MPSTEREVTISKEDLKEIIATAIAAAKAPNVVEQQKFDEQQRQIDEDRRQREILSQSVLADLEQKRQLQQICSHEHKNGDSHCVFIQEPKGPGYILCQKNQCKIRPGQKPANYKGNDIYDSALFNRLFQKLPTNELFQ